MEKSKQSKQMLLEQDLAQMDLIRWVEQMESEGLMRAPRGMKDSILQTIQQQESEKKETLPQTVKKRSAAKLFAYRMKICGAMAASLLMLFGITQMRLPSGYAPYEKGSPTEVTVQKNEGYFSKQIDGFSKKIFEWKWEAVQHE